MGKENINFLETVNGQNSPEISIHDLKKSETAMVSMVLSMSNIRVVHLDFRRGLIASPAPQLQWQPVVSWSSLTPPPPPKKKKI